jgi:signal transduction histidine kinase
MSRRHTLLVVDDEPDVVQSVQDLLRLDYQVLGATRAKDGLKILQEQEVHLVMTDQRMPEMTGVEFLSHVRGDHPEAIRLLFTGYADLKAVVDAINQGSVYRYITKPWDPDDLQIIIRQAAEQYDLLVERKRLLAELQEKNLELQQANEMKEAFIRVASHELRTPLTILYGLTQLALSTPGLVQPWLDWIRGSLKAGERLNRLVDQLTKMLLAGQFERPLEKRPTELTPLLKQAAEDVRPFVEQRRQELSMKLDLNLGSLNIEAQKIRDCVEHLLLNAIKFTPDQGMICLSARRLRDGEGERERGGEEKGRGGEGARGRQDSGVEIKVSDSGVGIEPSSLPHVFEPFFTSFDVSRHSSGQFEFGRRGLGLGLTLVKAFVEMHGGQVHAASEPGKGTTFTISLPADRPG